jgi:hypothetical protein
LVWGSCSTTSRSFMQKTILVSQRRSKLAPRLCVGWGGRARHSVRAGVRSSGNGAQGLTRPILQP